jgi:transposase
MRLDLSTEQAAELRQLARCGDPAHLRVKALALLNWADHRPVTLVAGMFRIARKTLYDWRERYLAGGVDGLRVGSGRGRRPRADLAEIERYVRQSPRNFGVPRTRWTLALLAEVVPSLKGFTRFGVQQALRRAGFSYKRGQPWVHSPDPDYQEKKTP